MESDIKIGILTETQRIRLHNGNVISARQLSSESILMGEQSNPVSILGIVKAPSKVYKLTTVGNDVLTLGEDHILPMKCSYRNSIYFSSRAQKYIAEWNENGCKRSKSFKTNEEALIFVSSLEESKGQIYYISVKDFILKDKTWKDRYAIYKTRFDYQEKEVDIDPYFIGLWLGDGSTNDTTITNINLLKFFIKFHNFRVRHNLLKI